MSLVQSFVWTKLLFWKMHGYLYSFIYQWCEILANMNWGLMVFKYFLIFQFKWQTLFQMYIPIYLQADNMFSIMTVHSFWHDIFAQVYVVYHFDIVHLFETFTGVWHTHTKSSAVLIHTTAPLTHTQLLSHTLTPSAHCYSPAEAQVVWSACQSERLFRTLLLWPLNVRTHDPSGGSQACGRSH